MGWEEEKEEKGRAVGGGEGNRKGKRKKRRKVSFTIIIFKNPKASKCYVHACIR